VGEGCVSGAHASGVGAGARRPRQRLPGPSATLLRVRTVPTAPVAAGSLIAGYAVAAGTGSRPLGGIVLLAGGLWCVRVWVGRHGVRTAIGLGCAGLAAFIASHLLALAIGPWPSVLLVSAAMAVVAWTRSDARMADGSRALAFRPRPR
jgi:hypothetical protein